MNPRGSGLDSRGKEAPETEPKAGLTQTPVILIVLLGLAVYWAQLYLDGEAGGFHREVYAPYTSVEELVRLAPAAGGDAARLAKGKVVFETYCGLCHDNTGQGKPGQAPPLAGSEWVNTTGPARMIRIPQVGLAGPIKVKGQDWNLAMAPMGAPLSDSDLADVLSYIRNSWGNKASMVQPEQVKAVRAQVAGRTDPWSVDELLKIPDSE